MEFSAEVEGSPVDGAVIGKTTPGLETELAGSADGEGGATTEAIGVTTGGAVAASVLDSVVGWEAAGVSGIAGEAGSFVKGEW